MIYALDRPGDRWRAVNNAQLRANSCGVETREALVALNPLWALNIVTLGWLTPYILSYKSG